MTTLFHAIIYLKDLPLYMPYDLLKAGKMSPWAMRYMTKQQ
jgi:hypothetical protein